MSTISRSSLSTKVKVKTSGWLALDWKAFLFYLIFYFHSFVFLFPLFLFKFSMRKFFSLLYFFYFYIIQYRVTKWSRMDVCMYFFLFFYRISDFFFLWITFCHSYYVCLFIYSFPNDEMALEGWLGATIVCGLRSVFCYSMRSTVNNYFSIIVRCPQLKSYGIPKKFNLFLIFKDTINKSLQTRHKMI